MTPEQKAAFVIAQSVEAFAIIAGMMAENAIYTVQGQCPIHEGDAFRKVIEDKDLHHNALITFFQD